MNNNSTTGYMEKCVLDGYPLLEPSTVCVIKAAIKHNLNYEILDEKRSFFRIYNDKKEEFIYQATKTSKDISTYPFITDNKVLVKNILRDNNFNVPDGILLDENMSVVEKNSLIKHFVGKSVVVKPNTTNRGTGITVFEKEVTVEELKEAIQNAFKYDSKVIVEDFKKGLEYRFLVIGDECICVLHRRAASVVGDGKSTISELIKEKNNEPWHGLAKRIITIDAVARQVMKRQGYNL